MSRTSPRGFEIARQGAYGLVRVSEDNLKDAVTIHFAAIHRRSRTSGAAALPGATKDRGWLSGKKKVNVVLSGGNIDRDVSAGILAR